MSVRILAADVIEPHVDGDFKRRWRAENIAADLDMHGLLRGGRPYPNPEERVVWQLQCRMEWRTAEAVAAELAAADLLTTC